LSKGVFSCLVLCFLYSRNETRVSFVSCGRKREQDGANSRFAVSNRWGLLRESERERVKKVKKNEELNSKKK